jgi:hypothetical protein
MRGGVSETLAPEPLEAGALRFPSGDWAIWPRTGASEPRVLRLLRLLDFFLVLVLLLLVTLLCVFEGVFFFLTPWVGTEKATAGDKVRARVNATPKIIRLAIQDLLG